MRPRRQKWSFTRDGRGKTRGTPNDRSLRRSLKVVTNQLIYERQGGRCAEVLRITCQPARRASSEGDQFGFYNHLKGMDVEGRRTFNSQYIKDEEDILLRGYRLIRESWVSKMVSETAKHQSSTVDPTIVDELQAMASVQAPGRRPV